VPRRHSWRRLFPAWFHWREMCRDESRHGKHEWLICAAGSEFARRTSDVQRHVPRCALRRKQASYRSAARNFTYDFPISPKLSPVVTISKIPGCRLRTAWLKSLPAASPAGKTSKAKRGQHRYILRCVSAASPIPNLPGAWASARRWFAAC